MKGAERKVVITVVVVSVVNISLLIAVICLTLTVSPCPEIFDCSTAITPVACPTTTPEPVTSPITCPPIEPITCPPIEPITCPPIEPFTCPTFEPITCPPIEPFTCPTFEPITCPTVTESTTTASTTTTVLPNPSFVVARDEWNASEPREDIPALQRPIKRIIIAHTGGSSCIDESDCKLVVKQIQTDNSHLDDIPYNFLIGGDGRVYEGRGFAYEGQHTANVDATEYNSVGICVAFIGNYQSTAPSASQLEVLNDFIEYFATNEVIADDYIIISQSDLMYTNVTATAINEIIINMANFHPLQKVYTREEWNADRSAPSLAKFEKLVNWVLLTNIDGATCSNEITCTTIVKEQQRVDVIAGHDDIKFNFIVGDGFVYEGRGWDARPSYTEDCSSLAFEIAVIGNFTRIVPSAQMLDSLMTLLDDAAAMGKLSQDYKINGAQEVGHSGPGDYFIMKIMLSYLSRHGSERTNCSSGKDF